MHSEKQVGEGEMNWESAKVRTSSFIQAHTFTVFYFIVVLLLLFLLLSLLLLTPTFDSANKDYKITEV